MATTKKKLRIAQFVTSQRSLPQPKGVIWAPIDLAIDIADGVTAMGHEMTFYAPPSPKLPYKVISGKLSYGTGDAGFKERIEEERKRMPYGLNHVSLFDQYLMGLMMKDAEKGMYDVLHVHLERGMPLAEFIDVPVITTLHDPINPYGARAYRLFNGPKQHLVSISMAQRLPAPDLNYAANIYNGVDLEHFAFDSEGGDRFLFCGRLIQQKGVEDAIRAAKATKSGLDIVGRHYSRSYFEGIKRMCTGKVAYMGSKARGELPTIYANAKALLFPIKWEEPFGLVMAEAMACGTPVIAYDRGSVREVVKDGVTGYIVKTEKQLAAAMRKIGKIDRRACRDHVVKNFSTERMVRDYEKLYWKAAGWKR